MGGFSSPKGISLMSIPLIISEKTTKLEKFLAQEPSERLEFELIEKLELKEQSKYLRKIS
jgi:hypothetical protein